MESKLGTGHSNSAMLDNAILLDGVKFSYKKEDANLNPILSSISLRIKYGEICGIAGRNASGKTTLLNIMRGAIIPQEGKVAIAGELISENKIKYKLASVSLVSQQSDISLAPTMTVYENYVMSKQGKLIDLRLAYDRKNRIRCESLLAKAKIGLETKLDEQTRFLSGGQQQALSVLLALASNRKILLMDEPTAALDQRTAEKIYDMTIKLASELNASVIIVSHSLQDLIYRCHRIFVINHGRIARIVSNNEKDWNKDYLLQTMMKEES